MKESPRDFKAKRRRDFALRAADPEQGAAPLAAGGIVVTIHPMADDLELLAKLGVSPDQCTAVDSYWAVEDDVVFLQVSTVGHSGREPGLYARRGPYPPRYVNLVAIVAAPYITRTILERAASELLSVGWSGDGLTERLAKLTPTH